MIIVIAIHHDKQSRKLSLWLVTVCVIVGLIVNNKGWVGLLPVVASSEISLLVFNFVGSALLIIELIGDLLLLVKLKGERI